VAEVHDEDHEALILDGLDHPVIADPDPVEVIFTPELLDPMRPGVFGEGLQPCDDPPSDGPG